MLISKRNKLISHEMQVPNILHAIVAITFRVDSDFSRFTGLQKLENH